jgi:hypothetical protein
MRERVERRLYAVDVLQRLLDELDGGDLACDDGSGLFGERSHYGETLSLATLAL